MVESLKGRLLEPVIQQVVCKPKTKGRGYSLVVQWLRFCASTARGMGSIRVWGTKIPHAMWPKKKKTKGRNMLTDRGQGTLLSTCCVPSEYENNLSNIKILVSEEQKKKFSGLTGLAFF